MSIIKMQKEGDANGIINANEKVCNKYDNNHINDDKKKNRNRKE